MVVIPDDSVKTPLSCGRFPKCRGGSEDGSGGRVPEGRREGVVSGREVLGQI